MLINGRRSTSIEINIDRSVESIAVVYYNVVVTVAIQMKSLKFSSYLHQPFSPLYMFTFSEWTDGSAHGHVLLNLQTVLDVMHAQREKSDSREGGFSSKRFCLISNKYIHNNYNSNFQ